VKELCLVKARLTAATYRPASVHYNKRHLVCIEQTGNSSAVSRIWNEGIPFVQREQSCASNVTTGGWYQQRAAGHYSDILTHGVIIRSTVSTISSGFIFISLLFPSLKIYLWDYDTPCVFVDRFCGLVVRVLGYRSGGPGSIPGTTKNKKIRGSETGSTQPREYNWEATW
jgi:hypothetical protein